jgi:hypothetical protein
MILGKAISKTAQESSVGVIDGADDTLLVTPDAVLLLATMNSQQFLIRKADGA